MGISGSVFTVRGETLLLLLVVSDYRFLSLRYYLSYHTPRQVIWGFVIGVIFGAGYYTAIEILPSMWPASVLGRARTAALANPVSTWLMIRDSWAVWEDGGREAEWVQWRRQWVKKSDDHFRTRRSAKKGC